MNKTIFSLAGIYFLAMSALGFLGLFILNSIKGNSADATDLGQMLIMVIAFPLGSFLGTRSRAKGSLKFLHSDTQKLTNSKVLNTAIEIQQFDLMQFKQTLILSGLIETFVDYSEGIIKVRQQSKTLNLGCGAMVSFSNNKVNIKSFPIATNSKQKRHQFQNDLINLVKVLGK